MTTPVMQQLAAAQVSKEVPVNENFQSIEWSAVYARDPETTAALTWGYLGGRWSGFDNAEGTLALVGGSPTTTNYIVANRNTGAVSVSQASTNWDNHADYARVYRVVASGSAVESWEDHRAGLHGLHGVRKAQKRLAIAIGGSPTGYVLAEIQAASDILEFTGTLTENETVTVPTVVDQWIVFNNCSGSPPFTLAVKTASGTGIAIDQGKRAILYCDGTNVVRASADV
jgi:hypothetical protein